MQVVHFKLNSLDLNLSMLDGLIANCDVKLNAGDVVKSSCGQTLAHCVGSLTDFDRSITKKLADLMIEELHSIVSYNPKSKESDMDNMRYRGYATRYAVLPSGKVSFQMLVKSFGAPFWINVPAGASIKQVSLSS